LIGFALHCSLSSVPPHPPSNARILAVNITTVNCENVNTFSPARDYAWPAEPYTSVNGALHDSRYLAVAATEFG